MVKEKTMKEDFSKLTDEELKALKEKKNGTLSLACTFHIR